MACRILLKRQRKFLVNILCVSERKTIKNELQTVTRRGNRRHFSSSSSRTSTVAEHPFTAKRIGLFILSSTAAAMFVAEGQADNWWRDAEDEDTDTDINLPRVYNRSAIQDYWKQRPMSIARRLGHVIYEIGPIGVRYLGYNYSPFSSNHQIDLQLHEQVVGALSRDFKEALTNLGPAWIKAGQQLAIRPDLVHPIVLKELQKLCDAVRTTMSEERAMEILEQELGLEKVGQLQQLELVASASLGQVYKAQTKDGQSVAIKIQRPGMLKSFSLDLFLLQQYGDMVDAFTSAFTAQPPFHRALFDAFSQGSYSELDYENEAQNQLLFQREFSQRGLDHKVKIPHVFLDYTTRRVICTEWIDGVPLARSSTDTIQRLIPVGVELFLTQLLDIGIFHADPHVGNILVTSDEGMLCLIDFGLCVTVDAKERQAMTKALVNLLYRDFDALVTYDTKELGFLPEDFDTEPLKPILVKVLTGGLLEAGSSMGNRKRKLMEISSELNEIFFQYPFQVPPFFALVTRGLGLLEGIALSGDPDFDIFKASMPFIASKRGISLILSGATAKQEQEAPTEPHHQRSLRRRAKDSFSWLVSKWRADDNVASDK